ncbi:MAG: hypothetical protein CMJ40_04160 [Phycisphaerae bacterium]|nr:hypothetical protein [Phycisphaerae bacterium]
MGSWGGYVLAQWNDRRFWGNKRCSCREKEENEILKRQFFMLEMLFVAITIYLGLLGEGSGNKHS